MTTGATPRTAEDLRGRHRLRIGGAFGVTGGTIGIGLPAALLIASVYLPGGSIPTGGSLLVALSVLLAAGLILLVVSLVAYRSAFGILRSADRRFWIPSALCLVGSVGLLVLLVAAIVVGGASAEVAQCVQGSPTHALSCLRGGSTGEFLGANLVVVGFWLAGFGSLGIVAGLVLEGQRIRKWTLTAAAAVYAIALLVLVGPFTALFLAVPGTADLLVAVPLLAIIAPALVLAGTHRR